MQMILQPPLGSYLSKVVAFSLFRKVLPFIGQMIDDLPSPEQAGEAQLDTRPFQEQA